MRWVVAILVALMMEGAAARMYQWVDPETGTPYLSGSPPAWYRSNDGGPRVQVWEGDRLVDDTQWRASVERARRLREEAQRAQEERDEQERQRAAQAKLQERQEPEAAAVVAEDAEFASREEALEVVERAMQWVVQQAAKSAVSEDLLRRFAAARSAEEAAPASPMVTPPGP